MGALPKRRISRTRRDRRRTHDAAVTFHLVPCPDCGEMRRPHRVCPACGKYRGRQVIAASES